MSLPRFSSPIRDFLILVVILLSLLSCASAAMNGWLARLIVQVQEQTYPPVNPKYRTTGPAR